MIELNKKYGCLTVLDLGEEYKTLDEYKEIYAKYKKLLEIYKPQVDELERYDKIFKENPSLKEIVKNKNPKTIEEHKLFISYMQFQDSLQMDFQFEEFLDINARLKTHYKCICKCGKIHYYNEQTILKKPTYCYYPIYLSSSFTYSIPVQNARAKKIHDYKHIESVVLVDKKDLVPKEEYCEKYNVKRDKKLREIDPHYDMSEEDKIKAIPREFAKNYDIDYTGKYFETLYIKECTNDYLESEPYYPVFNRYGHIVGKQLVKKITVYKEYNCECSLCGEKQLINCDRFEIEKTSSGDYMGLVACYCHHISSFQWKTCKLLFDNNVKYKAEVPFPEILGENSKHPLRFDFVVYNDDDSIKCLIECQGEQHYKPIKDFGGLSGFRTQSTNDNSKRCFAKKNNIKLIEISYKQKKYEQIKDILIENEIISD